MYIRVSTSHFREFNYKLFHSLNIYDSSIFSMINILKSKVKTVLFVKPSDRWSHHA